MQNYRHILLAADLSDLSGPVTDRARDLAEKYQAQLSIVHAVEGLPLDDVPYGPMTPFDFDLTGYLLDSARKRIETIADLLAIPKDRRWVEIGRPKVEILRIAEEQSVDLIVMGTHGRHGIELLLGSTATGVMHHANCDVMAVRLR
jgi:universal stress protein A